ncbi:hypothetical protein [Halobaculum marinum]|uniref:Amino acid transporter n=1 Tax=Halobaculum marinum TaxID=3031996 RepID=A0ABD5WZQ6_9EURY|nr:hypothetical protein [Halobaculum sp. DT55]
MSTGRLASLVRVAGFAGVGLAAAVGGGLLYVPSGVAEGAGPQAPVAYLLAGGGVACLAVAFAVVASGPFGERGPVYGAVSRVWGSRLLGTLVAWPALAGYVALVALVAEWLGRLAPLPLGAGAYVNGTLDAPTGLAALLGVGTTSSLVADVVAVAVCALAVGVHLLGARRVALAVAVPAWGVVVGVGGLLLVAFVPGVGEFVAGNFDPLYPTFGLQREPVRSLVGGVGLALFAFVGVEATAYAVAAAGVDDGNDDAEGGTATDRTDTVWRAPVVAAVVAGGLVTLTAFVALGIIDWIRLNLADIPAADAIGAYLPVDPFVLTVVVSTVAGAAAVVALGVPATRTLAGFAELLPPLGRGPGDPPLASLVGVYGVAAALAVADLVAPALYVAVPGLALSYLAVAVTVVAMPTRRPDLWAACTARPSGRAGRLALGGAVAVAATLLGAALASDPATTLGLTLHRVSLAVFEFELVSDPLGGHVPALVVWELVGLGLFVVLRDYRASTGVDLSPLDPPAGSTVADEGSDDDGAGEADPPAGDDPERAVEP